MGWFTGEQLELYASRLYKKITIVYANYIGRIIFHNGTQTFSCGGTSIANNTTTICIQSPNEYLTSISGSIGTYEGFTVVTSLSFYTNQRRFGPFGYNIGTPFSYDGKGGMIVGFHGRQGKYVDAIGIYLMPKSLALHRNSTLDDSFRHQFFRVGMPRDVGPWGASGGKLWDDGVFSSVKQVCVHLGKSSNMIYGIQFEYVKRDAKTISSPVHGRTDSEKTEVVNLDGTHEYLIGISGFYGPVEGFIGSSGVISLTFYTNKKMYGPYGKERGEDGYYYFTSTASPGKIVGFHGRKSSFLSAIGVHMEYF